LSALPAHAATYHVKKTGSDSNSCASAQNTSTPKLTIGAGVACASGGDTIYILDNGVYAEQLIDVIPSGSAGAPTILKGNGNAFLGTGLVPTIKPPTTGGYTQVIRTYDQNYITLDGLIMDGTGIFNAIVQFHGTSHHNIVQNCEVRNMEGRRSDTNGGAGIGVPDAGHHITIQNNLIHHVGALDSPLSGSVHGIYFHGNDHIIQDNLVYNNSGFGIHVYHEGGSSTNDVIIRRNKSYNNGASGILYASGSRGQVYNNIVYANGFGSTGNSEVGIYVYWTAYDIQVYNNTIYGENGIALLYESSNGIIKNNVLYGNGNNSIVNNGFDVPPVISNNFIGNPSFVNAGAADFHLTSGSAARGYGANLSSVFTTDYAQVARPSVGSWDAGAYQFVSGGTPPPATQLVWQTQPVNSLSGQTMPDVSVRIADASGLTVTTATNNVTLTESTSGAAITGTTTRAAVNGIATFPGLSFASTGTNLRFQAASSGLTSALSNTFTITTPGSVATKLVWGTQPNTTTVGATMTTVTVRVTDVDGATVPSATNSVTLTENTTGATITGTTTRAAVSGIATFPGLSFTAACSYCRFQATASGLTSTLSNIFTIAPPTPPGSIAPPQSFRITIP
jgi:hypothetical protein